jgi:hypothetical protein
MVPSHFLKIALKNNFGQMPVAQAYNLSDLGGRDQEDHSLKPAWTNSPQDPILKIPIMKKSACGVSQGVCTEFKPQYHTQKKNSNFDHQGLLNF